MLALFLIVFIDLVGFGMVLPLLPFFGEHFGADAQDVTLLMATYSLMQFIFSPIWGHLSDRIGRRPVLILSLAGAVVSYVWLGLSTTLWELFAMRALSGISAGNVAAAYGYVADTTTPENRARGMGVIGAAFGAGFVFGPAIGGQLAGADPAHPSILWPGLAAAALSLVAMIATILFLPESLPVSARRNRHVVRQGRLAGFHIVAGERPLRLLVSIFFLTLFAFAGMETTFALWANHEFGWGVREVSWLFTFVGVLVVIVQGGLIGLLTRRFGEGALQLGGAFIMGLGLIGIPLSESEWMMVLSCGLLAVGMGIFQPSSNSLISRATSPTDQGTVNGVSQAMGSLARILGPALAGYFFTRYGPNTPYFIAAVIMVVATILALRVRSPARRPLGAG